MAQKKSLVSFEEVSFFLKVIGVYVAWKCLHSWLWHTPARKAAWQASLDGYASLYAWLTAHILNLIGYYAKPIGVYVMLGGNHFMWIAEHCLAIPAMVVFAFSMLLFQGRAIDKLWFIPLGVIGIFLINLFRLVSLGVLRTHLGEDGYELWHRYIFLGITYGLILGMVIWWMDRTMKNLNDEPKAV